MYHNRLNRFADRISLQIIAPFPPDYFGQPSAGLFWTGISSRGLSSCPSASTVLPWGAGVAFFLEWFEVFSAFLLLTSLNMLSLRNWVFVHQALSLGCFHGKDSAFAIVRLPIIPEEMELPEVTMQIFAADGCNARV
jgi:hypothetical protein